MINGMREVMFAQQEDEDLINQIYPDPDNMTYEVKFKHFKLFILAIT